MACKVRQHCAAKIGLWPMLRWSRTPIRQSGSIVSAAPEVRQSAATAASAASASQASIARTNSALAWPGLGSRDSSTLPSVQSPSLMSCACEVLKLSRAQSMGSSRSFDRGGLRQQVGRVDDQHRVELEADRVRLDVADAGQEEARQQVAVREPPLQVSDGHLEGPLAGRLLDPAHDRLDLGAEPDRVGPDLQVRRPRGRDRLSPAQFPRPAPNPIAEADCKNRRRRRFRSIVASLEDFSPSRARTHRPVSPGCRPLGYGRVLAASPGLAIRGDQVNPQPHQASADDQARGQRLAAGEVAQADPEQRGQERERGQPPGRVSPQQEDPEREADPRDPHPLVQHAQRAPRVK